MRAQSDCFRSLWDATATPGRAFPRLDGARKCDVAVVGGGYTGLSAALHLAEAGADVVLIETNEPGWGASGRNGGQLIPGLKYDPPEINSKFGPELGPRMVEFVGGSATFTFGLIERLGIECDARRGGWIQCAHTEAMTGALRRRAESWAALGAEVEIYDRAGMAAALGSEAYLAGWRDLRAGSVNPLSYARGLAAAAGEAGVAIFSNTRANGIERRARGYRLETTGGALDADTVILATNGYSDRLQPELRASVIPANSFQVATAPLDPETLAKILPQEAVASDSRRVLLYFRRGPGGRLVMGGVGSVGDPRSHAAFRHLRKAIARLFPSISAPLEFHWFGRVAITRDFLPHLNEIGPGLHAAVGYNGRGVALSTAMGAQLARRALGSAPSEIPFPVTPVKPIPLHGLRSLYVAAARAYYQLRDLTGG